MGWKQGRCKCVALSIGFQHVLLHSHSSSFIVSRPRDFCNCSAISVSCSAIYETPWLHLEFVCSLWPSVPYSPCPWSRPINVLTNIGFNTKQFKLVIQIRTESSKIWTEHEIPNRPENEPEHSLLISLWYILYVSS